MEQNPSFGGNKRTREWVSRGVRGEGWNVVVVPSAVTEAETACLMTAMQATYRLQAPPQQKPLACPSPATEFALYLRQQESGSALQAY